MFDSKVKLGKTNRSALEFVHHMPGHIRVKARRKQHIQLVLNLSVRRHTALQAMDTNITWTKVKITMKMLSIVSRLNCLEVIKSNLVEALDIFPSSSCITSLDPSVNFETFEGSLPRECIFPRLANNQKRKAF